MNEDYALKFSSHKLNKLLCFQAKLPSTIFSIYVFSVFGGNIHLFLSLIIATGLA